MNKTETAPEPFKGGFQRGYSVMLHGYSRTPTEAHRGTQSVICGLERLMNGGERLKVKDLQSAVEALGFELCKLTIPGKYCLIKNIRSTVSTLSHWTS